MRIAIQAGEPSTGRGYDTIHGFGDDVLFLIDKLFHFLLLPSQTRARGVEIKRLLWSDFHYVSGLKMRVGIGNRDQVMLFE